MYGGGIFLNFGFSACKPDRYYVGVYLFLQALVCIETPLGKPQGYIVDCTRKGAEGSQTKISFSQVLVGCLSLN